MYWPFRFTIPDDVVTVPLQSLAITAAGTNIIRNRATHFRMVAKAMNSIPLLKLMTISSFNRYLVAVLI